MMVYFTYVSGLLANILLKIFPIDVHDKYWSVALFFKLYLSYFGIRVIQVS